MTRPASMRTGTIDAFGAAASACGDVRAAAKAEIPSDEPMNAARDNRMELWAFEELREGGHRLRRLLLHDPVPRVLHHDDGDVRCDESRLRGERDAE